MYRIDSVTSSKATAFSLDVQAEGVKGWIDMATAIVKNGEVEIILHDQAHTRLSVDQTLAFAEGLSVMTRRARDFKPSTKLALPPLDL